MTSCQKKKAWAWAWGNSEHFAIPSLFSGTSSEITSEERAQEIPYWWYINIQIWEVLLTHLTMREICLNESKALPGFGELHVIWVWNNYAHFSKVISGGKPVVRLNTLDNISLQYVTVANHNLIWGHLKSNNNSVTEEPWFKPLQCIQWSPQYNKRFSLSQ